MITINTEYKAAMAVSGLQVNARQQFGTALTGQRISTAAASSMSTLTYMLQFPYQVLVAPWTLVISWNCMRARI